MSVSKPVTLFGVQHFGSIFGVYTVGIEVKDSADNSSIVKQSGSYASEKCKSENHQYYGFDVQFDRPIYLQENKKYKLVSLIEGPNLLNAKEYDSLLVHQMLAPIQQLQQAASFRLLFSFEFSFNTEE